MDPRTRIGLLLCVGALSVLLDRPASLGMLAAVSALPLLLLPIGWTWRSRALLASVVVVWSTVLSQGLFYGDVPRVALVSVGPFTIFKEGIGHGLIQSLRFIAVTYAGIAVAVSTPADRLFAALVRLRVPYGIAFVAVTALRFVPEVGREVLIVRHARAVRGRAAWARGPWAWVTLEMQMLRPVVARSLRRATAMAESLDTRGFDASSPRAVRRPLRMVWWEGPLLVGAVLGTAAIAVAELLYWLYLAEVFYEPGLRPLYGFVRVWL